MSENQTEAELESFRQKWREEVSAKAKGRASASKSTVPSKVAQASSSKLHRKTNAPEVPLHSQHQIAEESDALEPVHEHLGEKQHGRRLDETSPPPVAHEPNSALEHYEKAVEKENQGSLGDSVSLYRKAFKVSIMPFPSMDVSQGTVIAILMGGIASLMDGQVEHDAFVTRYYYQAQAYLTRLTARLQRPPNIQEQTLSSRKLSASKTQTPGS